MSWNYDAIIGFSNGMLKGVELKKNKFKYTALLDAAVGLNTLSCYDEKKAIISSKRKIFLFDLKNKKFVKRYIIQEEGSIIGVFKKNDVLITGVESGIVVVQPLSAKNTELKKINVGPNLSCMRQVLTSDNIATGGNDNPLKIWDLEMGIVKFIAKRPKPDMLQLKQPCYVSDIGLFNNNKVVVSHRHGVVDLHDPLSSQRRPVATCKAENTGFVSLTTIPDYSDYEVLVGTSKGSIFHYDFRGKSALPVKTFRGSTGSVKSLSSIIYSNQIHLMSISLDCHIRIHNFTTGHLTNQDYIVAKPTALLMKPEELTI